MSNSTTWCPACDEHCLDHPSMCTICGENLVTSPSTASTPVTAAAGGAGSGAGRTPAVRFVNSVEQNERGGGRGIDVATVLGMGMGIGMDANGNLTGGTDGTGIGTGIGTGNGTGGEIWEDPPPEAMNPQPQTASQSKSTSSKTSQSFLDNLERITIHANSAILHQATIEITATTTSTTTTSTTTESKNYNFQATISEFKPHPPFDIHGSLHLSQPIHGTSPIHINSTSTSTNIPTSTLQQSNSEQKKEPIILYMERGQNTFVQKVINATSSSSSSSSASNIQAIICSNNNATWPYIMKDSTGKANKDNICKIPIVMIQKSDGQILHSLLKKQLSYIKDDNSSCNGNGNSNNNSINKRMTIKTKLKAIKKSPTQNSCIICTDTYKVNDVIIQLQPMCTHTFHESCILHWLHSHNTCPYCRKEMPLEDEKEEEERRSNRRRDGNTSAGTGTTIGNSQYENAEQWETIFG